LFFILGSSSGIGRGTAVFFSKYGAKLVITGRNEKNLDETIQLCHNNSSDNVISFFFMGCFFTLI
jgi:NADP-dependent 3-hydroxy acid dehydrogenase YdfG